MPKFENILIVIAALLVAGLVGRYLAGMMAPTTTAAA